LAAVAALFLVVLPVASVAGEPGSNETWYIDPSDLLPADPEFGLVDADRLQDAIDLAAPGDTIVMTAGTWESLPDSDDPTATRPGPPVGEAPDG
jgi:hypothetical protein